MAVDMLIFLDKRDPSVGGAGIVRRLSCAAKHRLGHQIGAENRMPCETEIIDVHGVGDNVRASG